jgi:hypothetical protein
MPTTVVTAIVAPVTQQQAPSVPWRPSNEVENRLVAALRNDDRPTFFTILQSAPLYLPQSVENPDTTTEASSDDYVTFTSGDATYLLVFTSLETLQQSVGEIANGYVESDYPTLRAALAESDVQLGFNLGTPIDAWLDVESLARAAAGEIAVPTGLEMADIMEVTDPTNAEEVEEASQQELEKFVNEYITGLVTGDVLVVTRNGAWRIAPHEGLPSIEAYSHAEHVPPGTPTTSVSFLSLVKNWPAGAEQLAVNPGTDLAFVLPTEVLQDFAQHAQLHPPDA